MPSVSKAQHKLMVAVAHNPDLAKKKDIPQSVGKKFEQEDKAKHFYDAQAPTLQEMHEASEADAKDGGGRVIGLSGGNVGLQPVKGGSHYAKDLGDNYHRKMGASGKELFGSNWGR